MEEKLTDITIDLLLSGIGNKVNGIKENCKWKGLFVNIGSFLINNPDKLKLFENDLRHKTLKTRHLSQRVLST